MQVELQMMIMEAHAKWVAPLDMDPKGSSNAIERVRLLSG